MNKPDRHSYEFGPFRLEPSDHLLLRNGEPVALTPKVFDLLLLLVENKGRVLAKPELMERLWPDTFVDEGNLPRAVSTLRQALGESSNPREYIETIPKRGYRFVAEVREAQCQEKTISLNPVVPTAESVRPGSIPVNLTLRRGSVPLMISTLLIIALIALIEVWTLRRAGTQVARVISTTRPSPRRSIAVLGFRNVSRQVGKAWLSTALSEMLTTELAAGGNLRALGQDDVTELKADLAIGSAAFSSEMLERIHRRLGADLFVSGTYLVLEGDRQSPVRLDLRIQDVSGKVVASAVETGHFADLFEIADRAAAKLRNELQVQEASRGEKQSIKASMPVDRDAARLYAQGLDRLRSFDLLSARGLFEDVVTAETNFPLAHMRLAEIWSDLGYDTRAKEEAKKAFDLSGALPQEERLWVEGHYREMAKEWDLAIEIYRRLWGFFPDEPDYALALVSAQASGNKKHDALATLAVLSDSSLSAGDRSRVALAEAYACDGVDHDRELTAARKARKEGELQGAKLLVARASLLESYALGDGGHEKEASLTVRNTQSLFSAVGDQVGYARALIYESNLLGVEGKIVNREALYGQALQVCRQIGNKRCEAAALNNLAGILEGSSDFGGAEKRYRESLLIFQDIDDKSSAGTALNNIGTVREIQGDLVGARKAYDQALAQQKTAGSKAGQGSALLNIADVLRLQGQLIQAKKTMEESLADFREAGVSIGGPLASMAEIQFHEGDLDGAEQSYQESLSMGKELGLNASADTRVRLAAVWIAKNHLADAEKVLSERREISQRERQKGSEILATTLLLKDLLLEGKIEEARATTTAAAPLASDMNDKLGVLPLTIAMAQVQATLGNTSEAMKALRATLDLANRYGLVEYAFEARLALGKIEIKSGNVVGRARLQTLQKEAQARGLGEIAKEAQQSLNVNATSDIAAQRINR